MPAITTPPGASTGATPAESTRHSASRRCAGRSRISAAWPGRVDRGDRAGRRAQAIRTGSRRRGATTPGKIRAPLETMLPAPSDTPLPSTLSPSTWQSSPIVTPAPTMQPLSVQFGADRRALEHDRALDGGVLADGHPALEHDAPADLRVRADAAARLDQRRRDDPPRGLHVVGDAGEAGAHPRGDLGVHGPLEDVERPLQVAVRRPDVHPVALADVAVEPVADEPREHVALDRGGLAGRQQLEHRALEHVRAGGDVVRVDLVGRGLLDELRDPRRPASGARARRRRGPRPASAPASPAHPSPRAGRSARSGRGR